VVLSIALIASGVFGLVAQKKIAGPIRARQTVGPVFRIVLGLAITGFAFFGGWT
jgi:hypothetical protein